MGFPFLETIPTQLPNPTNFFGFLGGFDRVLWVDPTHEHPYLYTRYPSHTHVLKMGKTHTKTQSKWKKPIKLGLVRAGNYGYGFCCHAYL
jgi:hypothetical protein